MGNVVMDEESENTHVINELGLPIMCIGTRNLVIAASNGLAASRASSRPRRSTLSSWGIAFPSIRHFHYSNDEF